MITHIVRRAGDTDALEQQLDNAINRGWKLVSLVPVVIEGTTSSFWIVFSKGDEDD